MFECSLQSLEAYRLVSSREATVAQQHNYTNRHQFNASILKVAWFDLRGGRLGVKGLAPARSPRQRER